MRIYKLKCLLILVLLFVAGCASEKKITSIKDFNAWANETKNGVIISRSVNGVKVTVNYLTPEFNALNEMELHGLKGKQSYDSLFAYYKTTAAFVMTLGPDESKNNTDDIMYKGVKNFQEYVAQALALNFDIENQVSLEANSNKYPTSLSSLDNSYGLSNFRKINFVFTPINKKDELENATHFNFVYTDKLFDLGTLNFYFDKKKIEQALPEISIP